MSGSDATAPALADRLGAAREAAGELWAWWKAELAGMLPDGLRRRLAAPPPVLLADLAGAEMRLGRLEGGGTAWRPLPAGAAAPAGLPVWLRLPAGAVLTRRLDWPQMSMADLRRAILLDLDRQTPCAAEELYLDLLVTGRDPARRRVALLLAVARRPVVEAALARLAEAGLPAPSRIGVAPQGARNLVAPAGARHLVAPQGARDLVAPTGAREPHAPTGARDLAGHLLPGAEDPTALAFDLRPAIPEPGAATARRRSLLPASAHGRLLLLCALLGALNLGLHAESEARRAARLDAAVAEARQRAQRVEALRQQITERRRIRDSIVARRGEISLLSILEHLTRVIPDDAWLDSVEVRGSSLYVTGHAPLAVSLVPLIETSPMFADAQFRSPVTPDRSTGRERFDLSIRLRTDAP